MLKELFCIVHKGGYKLEDKILRNEILVILSNILEDGLFIGYVARPPLQTRCEELLGITLNNH